MFNFIMDLIICNQKTGFIIIKGHVSIALHQG